MKKIYEEQKKVWEKIIEDLHVELYKLIAVNIDPKMIICDAVRGIYINNNSKSRI